MFASLRPKYCILSGAAGTHTVCVCAIHQNVKLLLNAINCQHSYKYIIDKLLCDKNKHDCLLRLCSKCKIIKDKLLKNLFDDVQDIESEKTISYHQWAQGDRAELKFHISTIYEFLEILLDKFDKLIPQYYISHQQSQYLKDRKKYMQNYTAIILLDFSENYTFVI